MNELELSLGLLLLALARFGLPLACLLLAGWLGNKRARV
jgi:hypothetical protein